MPSYQFRCPECSHEFEGSQHRDATEGLRCPKCGATAKRLIGCGGGFILRTSSSGSRDGSGSQGTCRRQLTGVRCCGSDTPCDKSENCD